MDDYYRMSFLIDSVFQTQLSAISVNGKGNNQIVEVLQGLVGKTPGPKRLEIKGTWAVPKNGLETDLITSVADGTYHEIQIPVGDKTLTSQGWFEDFELGQSTSQSTEFSANYIGKLNPPD